MTTFHPDHSPFHCILCPKQMPDMSCLMVHLWRHLQKAGNYIEKKPISFMHKRKKLHFVQITLEIVFFKNFIRENTRSLP